jgi:hypothetical protein
MEHTEKADTDLVHARARVHKTERHEHLVDVDVIDRSPEGDGPDQSVVKTRQEPFIDHSADAPGDITVINIPPEDPPASWPAEEREWLRDLIAEHGPLERKTVHPDPAWGDLDAYDYDNDDNDDDDDDGGIVIAP